MVAPAKFAHVVFRTNQIDTMVGWYCTFLEAHVAYRDAGIAFLTYDDEHHRIALIGNETYAPKPEGKTVGFYHAAFGFRNLGDLLGNYERLKALSVLPYRPINHGPTVSMYYRDPDGNELEMQVDSFPDAARANAWMQSEAFARDPIGILFDPEEMIRRYRAGVPELELLRRPDA